MKIKEFDEIAYDLFKDIQIVDKDNKKHPVPLLWASDEKATMYVLSEEAEDRIKLPIIHFERTEVGLTPLAPSVEYWCSYQFFIKTLFQEDANQIIEQILSKFTPTYKKDGKICDLSSTITNNHVDSDAKVKVCKWAFSVMVQGG